MASKLRIVGVVIVIFLIILVALPFLINVNAFRPRLESELTETLGRQVRVANLGLSILSGSVSANELSIADDPSFSQSPFVRARSLKVGVEWMPLVLSRSLKVTSLTLDRPEIVLLRTASGKCEVAGLRLDGFASDLPPRLEKFPLPVFRSAGSVSATDVW
jgi:AsmA protein